LNSEKILAKIKRLKIDCKRHSLQVSNQKLERLAAEEYFVRQILQNPSELLLPKITTFCTIRKSLIRVFLRLTLVRM